MSVREIAKKIISDARERAELTEKHALRDAGRIVKSAEGEASRVAETGVEKGRSMAMTERQQTLAAAKLAGRDEVIKAKRDMIENVIDITSERLESMDEKMYDRLLADLIVMHARDWSEVIFDTEISEKRAESIMDSVNKRLAKAGPSELELANERRRFGRGYILKAGRVEEDRSFKTMLDQAAEDLEDELMEILFKE